MFNSAIDTLELEAVPGVPGSAIASKFEAARMDFDRASKGSLDFDVSFSVTISLSVISFPEIVTFTKSSEDFDVEGIRFVGSIFVKETF